MALPLISLGIVELDTNRDLMSIWTYPSCDEDIDGVARARCRLGKGQSGGQCFSRFRGQWLYSDAAPNANQSSKSRKRVAHIAVYVCAKTYHPELYLALCKTARELYEGDANPVDVMQLFIAAYGSGKAGAFSAKNFDINEAYLTCALMDTLKALKEQFVMLWMAMLLKKRVVVYCPNLEQLQLIVRTMPLLVWHRENFDVLRPLVNLSEVEIADLSGHFVAGFTDESCKAAGHKLYDVLLDVPAQSIVLSDKAAASMEMGSYHTEFGEQLAAASESTKASDKKVLKAMMAKTDELFSNLRALAEQGPLTREGLQDQGGSSMANFLYSTALAENMAGS